MNQKLKTFNWDEYRPGMRVVSEIAQGGYLEVIGLTENPLNRDVLVGVTIDPFADKDALYDTTIFARAWNKLGQRCFPKSGNIFGVHSSPDTDLYFLAEEESIGGYMWVAPNLSSGKMSPITGRIYHSIDVAHRSDPDDQMYPGAKLYALSLVKP